MYKIDSRKVVSGDTYVALRGISSDGHDYILDAINNGASKIICETGNYSVPTIIVKNTRSYLEEILYKEYKNELSKIKIIGVTGTNGKTSVSYFLYQLLNMTGNKCGYIGTIGYYLENKICNLPNTTPDLCEIYNMLLEAINKNFKYMVIEVSSQGLCYGRLNTIEFDCSIFTNLTMEHLDFHKTMKNYALAKQVLFKQSKCGIINIDDEYKDYFLFENSITYGLNGNYKLISFNNGVLKYNNEAVKLDVEGLYNGYNLLATIACLDYFKIKDYKKYISKLELPDGRLKKIKYRNNLIIIDYAHTPDALEKVINIGRDLSKNKVITIFGCTGDRLKEKRPIMGSIASKLSDIVIITTVNTNSETLENINKDIISGISNGNYELINNRSEAIRKGISYLNNEDVLLVLGLGHKESIVSREKKYHFNDLEEVNKILKELEITSK